MLTPPNTRCRRQHLKAFHMQLLLQFQSLAHHTRCTNLGPKAEYRPLWNPPNPHVYLYFMQFPALRPSGIQKSWTQNKDVYICSTRLNSMYIVQLKYGTDKIFWQLSDIWHFSLILGAFSNCLQFPWMKDRLCFCVQSSVIHHLLPSQRCIKPLHWMLQCYFRVAWVQQKHLLPPDWAHLWILALYSPLSSAWLFL